MNTTDLNTNLDHPITVTLLYGDEEHTEQWTVPAGGDEADVMDALADAHREVNNLDADEAIVDYTNTEGQAQRLRVRWEDLPGGARAVVCRAEPVAAQPVHD